MSAPPNHLDPHRAASWRRRVVDLAGLTGARCTPSWDAIKALGAVTLAAAVVSGLLGWRAHPVHATPRQNSGTAATTPAPARPP